MPVDLVYNLKLHCKPYFYKMLLPMEKRARFVLIYRLITFLINQLEGCWLAFTFCYCEFPVFYIITAIYILCYRRSRLIKKDYEVTQIIPKYT